MKAEDKEKLICIMNNFETRSNKDIDFLMQVAYDAGRNHPMLFPDYESFKGWIKLLLDL